jgi:hypothetical protein
VLTGLDYGLLALGDSSYARYCAFGRQLDAWLQIQGATPFFDRVEVDDADGGALRHWQYHLGKIAGTSEAPDWAPSALAEWRLDRAASAQSRQPRRAGLPPRLEPMEGGGPKDGIEWQAGDIAEIGPRNARAALDRFPPYFLEALRDRMLPDDPAELAGLSPERRESASSPCPIANTPSPRWPAKAAGAGGAAGAASGRAARHRLGLADRACPDGQSHRAARPQQPRLSSAGGRPPR